MPVINICEECSSNIKCCTCYDRTIEEYIFSIREFNQIQIYTVNEVWCVQLFDLNDCPNDIGVFCVFETNNKSLEKALKESFEWALENY